MNVPQDPKAFAEWRDVGLVGRRELEERFRAACEEIARLRPRNPGSAEPPVPWVSPAT